LTYVCLMCMDHHDTLHWCVINSDIAKYTTTTLTFKLAGCSVKQASISCKLWSFVPQIPTGHGLVIFAELGYYYVTTRISSPAQHTHLN
jgi:hypothetical protein